jgi:high-affinity nickel-transport protein
VNPFDDLPTRIGAKVGLLYALLIVSNVSAWVWAWLAFAHHPALLGMAFLAYTFGLRHAFDADHIAAIDNVVRKLMQAGKRPLSVGLFFSLGHSTIVILASAAIAGLTIAAHEGPGFMRGFGGPFGTAVSAAFLLILGSANLLVFRNTWRALLRLRQGQPAVEEETNAVLGGHGIVSSLLGPLFTVISHSWRMYLVGFLFGLGFDTATEIGVLGLSASQAARSLSPWAILVFPALFTAGMTLVDTSDSVLMTGAYGWAFTNPIRKLWYNLTITGASVVVAVFIGGLEALGLIGAGLRLGGGFWKAVGAVSGSLTTFGYAVVAIFVASWIVSALVYRVGGFDRPITPPR